MQRHQRSVPVRYAILLISFSLMSCGVDMPQKPIVNICAIEAPELRLACASTRGNEKKVYKKQFGIQEIEQSDLVVYRPISLSDKYICFSPDHYGRVISYLQKIESRLKTCFGE